MGSNVYLTGEASASIDLQVVHVGPRPEFNGHFHLQTDSVAADAKNVEVMRIDRGGDYHVGDAVGISELQFWIAGVFVGALQVMLDNSTDPFKDAMHWSWRTPAAAGEGRWTEKRATRMTSYRTDAADVQITIGERAAFFDDLHVTVKAGVAGYRAVTAIRDPRRTRLLAFALDASGVGVAAQAQMCPESESPAPAWQHRIMRAAQDAKLVGEPTILRSIDATAPAYLTARTGGGGLWLADVDSGAQWQVPITVGRAPLSSLLVGAMWAQSDKWLADVFATAGPGGQLALYHNVLRLSSPPQLLRTDWDDWKSVLLRPSYAVGESQQYLFALTPTTLGGQGIYYCSASWGGRFGMWHSLPSLPGSARATALTAFTWTNGEEPQDPAALVCVANDGRAYAWVPAFPNEWKDLGRGPYSGAVDIGVLSSKSPLVARSTTGLIGGYGTIKEAAFWLGRPIPDSRPFGPFATLSTRRKYSDQHELDTVLVLQSDNGRGPFGLPFSYRL